MDLSIIIPRLYPKARFRLSSSTPPHSVIEWKESYPQPDALTLAAEWQLYLAEQQAIEDKKEEIRTQGKKYQLLINNEIQDVFILSIL